MANEDHVSREQGELPHARAEIAQLRKNGQTILVLLQEACATLYAELQQMVQRYVFV